MSYDEELALRLQGALVAVDGISTKRMFGGLAFLLHGHIAIAASGKGGLMARVDPSDCATLLALDGVEPMVMGGREMDGWVRVTSEACDTEASLTEWIDRGLAVVRALPPQ